LTDDQAYPEAQEDFEECQVYAHLWSEYLLGIAC
jgi:hypothetical protein